MISSQIDLIGGKKKKKKNHIKLPKKGEEDYLNDQLVLLHVCYYINVDGERKTIMDMKLDTHFIFS